MTFFFVSVLCSVSPKEEVTVDVELFLCHKSGYGHVTAR
jgi:hypothetical protein